MPFDTLVGPTDPLVVKFNRAKYHAVKNAVVPPPPKLIVASPKNDWHQFGTKLPPWMIVAESNAPPSKAGAPLAAPMLVASILAAPTLKTPTLLANARFFASVARCADAHYADAGLS